MNKRPHVIFIEEFLGADVAETFRKHFEQKYKIERIGIGGRFDVLWMKTGLIEHADVIVFPYYDLLPEIEDKIKSLNDKFFQASLEEVASIRKAPVPVIFLNTSKHGKAVSVEQRELECGIAVDVVFAEGHKEENLKVLADLIDKKMSKPIDVSSMFPEKYYSFFNLGPVYYAILRFMHLTTWLSGRA